MTISIAMTTYNGSKYLQEQLDSFVWQTRQPDELVVCDDCSTDDTIDILNRFKNYAPFRVRIFSNEINIGYSKNFERALSLCSGDIVFLSDQDDVWLEEKLYLVETAFNNNPDIMLIINDSFVSDEYCKERFHSKLSNSKFNGLSEDAYIAGCATAIRSEFLKLVLPFPDSKLFSHDLWVNKLAILSAVRMVLPQQMQLYRRHACNVTKSSVAANKKVYFPMLLALKTFGLKDCRHGWREQILLNNLFIERLEKFNSIENSVIFSSANLCYAVSELNKKNIAITARIRLIGYPRYLRVYQILILFLNGFYVQFNGWKSAVKDVFR